MRPVVRHNQVADKASHDQTQGFSGEDAEQCQSGSSRTSSLMNDRISASEHMMPSTDSDDELTSYGPHFSAKRHLSGGNPAKKNAHTSQVPSWKSKNKLKTTNAALVVCLNIDVDPPDVVKTSPCAVLECWVDPHSLPSNKALEAIGNNLHHQFECLSPRIKFKPYLDPSYEETQKFCQSLRKMAKDERCLFYYNGHGVPKPTPSGELWVFNRSYSQYIPVSLIEIQNWLGSPCIYIWDCSAAGNLLTNFINFAEKRDADAALKHGGYPDGMMPFMESIQLAACLAHEQLPMYPGLPADLFTSCLTSPIDIALRWYLINQNSNPALTFDMVQRIPGDLKDRRTPLGELNWIFVSITDTIAWTTFSKDIFYRLYRSDLLVACLFRNFLLAERIMKNYHCTPHTYPPLPPTNTHPMWAQWDLAVDAVMKQLPDLLKSEKVSTSTGSTQISETPYSYLPSRFFVDQLTAFEVWISRGGSALTKRGPGSLAPSSAMDGADYASDAGSGKGEGLEHLVPRKPPEQLPIVLQLLLSQPHRLRVLILLSKFVDLGPWAVHYALTIGIFPFIVKLLQAPARDLRPVLIFIWARILAVDPSCQTDLFNNRGYEYFANALALPDDPNVSFSNGSEQRSMCCFILSAICRGLPQAQNACWQERVFDSCYERLDEDDFLPRQWMALCIGQIWDANDDIKIYGVDRGTQDKLLAMLSDVSPEVRTAALFALGTFMGASGSVDPGKKGGGGTGSMYHLEEKVHFRLEVAVATGAAIAVKDDASPMVRKELLILLSCVIREWRGYFVVAAWLYWEEERKRAGSLFSRSRTGEDVTSQAVAEWLDGLGEDEVHREDSRILLSSFYTIYAFLLELSVDPYPEVASYAQTLVDYIMALLLESPFSGLDSSTLHLAPPVFGQRNSFEIRIQSQSGRVPLSRSESVMSNVSVGSPSIMRRTASLANSLKNLANQYAFPTSSSDDTQAKQPAQKSRDAIDLLCPPSPNLNHAEYISPFAVDSKNENMALVPQREDGQLREPRQPCNYLPSEVMEALIEEDMERLRARRRKKSHQQRHYQQYAHASDGITSPSGSTFSHDSSVSVLRGLGTGDRFKDILPFKSRFYDWCCEYFTESQIRQPESQEPGSMQYNEQMWRQQRNVKIMLETSAQADVARHCKWDRSVATLTHGGAVQRLVFHAFDPYLFISSDSNLISVYDWTRRERLLVFNNGNPIGTGITSLSLINQDVGGMIMSGSSEGTVRLYRNYDDTVERPVQMVTSFRALGNMVSMKRGTGLVLGWQQLQGIILAGGDSRTVRIWDVHRECSVNELATQIESPITCFANDPDSPSLFIASFGDGTIQLFDRRLDEEDAVVNSFREHTSLVQGVRWQRGAAKDLVSASVDGEIKLWDMRRATSPITTWSLFPEGIAAFDVHEQCSVFAVTGALTPARWRQQSTAVHSLHAHPPQQPALLSRLSFPSGLHHAPASTTSSSFSAVSTSASALGASSSFSAAGGAGVATGPTTTCSSVVLGTSTGAAASIAFHPHEMLVALGSADGTIRLLGSRFGELATKPVSQLTSYSTFLSPTSTPSFRESVFGGYGHGQMTVQNGKHPSLGSISPH